MVIKNKSENSDLFFKINPSWKKVGDWSYWTSFPSTQICLPLLWNNSSSLNDSISRRIFFESGSYSGIILGMQTNDSGMLSIYLNNDKILDKSDFYKSTTNYNWYKNLSFTVSKDSVKTLKICVEDKNELSDGYHAYLAFISFW